MIGLAFQRYSRGTGGEAGRMRETKVGRGGGGCGGGRTALVQVRGGGATGTQPGKGPPTQGGTD